MRKCAIIVSLSWSLIFLFGCITRFPIYTPPDNSDQNVVTVEVENASSLKCAILMFSDAINCAGRIALRSNNNQPDLALVRNKNMQILVEKDKPVTLWALYTCNSIDTTNGITTTTFHRLNLMVTIIPAENHYKIVFESTGINLASGCFQIYTKENGSWIQNNKTKCVPRHYKTPFLESGCWAMELTADEKQKLGI